jgi:DNA gyrase subunit B
MDAGDIVVLPGLEAVRRRPSMYVGPLDAPATLSDLVEQVMCASLDEAVAGRCQRIIVTLHADGSASVVDDGPGMSIERDRQGMRAAERLMTSLLACRAARRSATVADGFCGIGIAVVNALSEWCRLEVRREGTLWSQTYAAGVPTSPFEERGATTTSGTTVHFRPDRTILQVESFDAADLRARLDAIRASLDLPTELVLRDAR